jgi:hypothetical protein
VKTCPCIPTIDRRPLRHAQLHQTSPDGGRESVGLAGSKSLAFAADLAERLHHLVARLHHRRREDNKYGV